jgi:hypothetical protein
MIPVAETGLDLNPTTNKKGDHFGGARSAKIPVLMTRPKTVNIPVLVVHAGVGGAVVAGPD